MSTRTRAGVSAMCLAWLTTMVGCAADASLVLVDLRTDYVPGLEIASVETDFEIDPSQEPRGRPQRTITRFSSGDALVAGMRIAEFDRVRRGTHTLFVRLIDTRGGVVATRSVRATVVDTQAIVVIITRRCRGVVCPQSGDSADLTECLDGRCVSPECTPATPELCGEPTCADDRDCPSAGCALGVCVSGSCLLDPRDSACGAGLRCHPIDGCVEVPDGGAPDAGPDAGRDAGRDAGVDAGPAPCVPPSCDDGNACTDDSCGASGCVNTPIDARCDDGVACTDDSCGAGGCVNTRNDARCDDGVACTDDSCGAGGCVNTRNDARCDDGVACTDDSCGAGGCVNTPNDARCDDGVNCTDDSCGSTGCVNNARNGRCNDGNVCTDDTCEATGCVNRNNSAPCNDGVFCNGPDTCRSGSCSLHAGNPCNVGADEICSE